MPDDAGVCAVEEQGRPNRRQRRAAAREAEKQIMVGKKNIPEQETHWGTILTYWGTLLGWVGVGCSVLNHEYIASIFFVCAIVQIILGMWLWWGRRWPVAGRIFLSVVLVGLFAWRDWDWLAHMVSISPSKITFNAPLANDRHIFTITNEKDADVYAVTFALRVESADIPGKDFSIGVPKSSDSTRSEIGGMRCRDTQGRAVFYVEIYRLSPHERRDVTLTRTTSKPATVSAKVTNYVDDAPQIVNPNMTMTPFYLDRTLTCEHGNEDMLFKSD